jgi:hypothetical protein
VGLREERLVLYRYSSRIPFFIAQTFLARDSFRIPGGLDNEVTEKKLKKLNKKNKKLAVKTSIKYGVNL